MFLKNLFTDLIKINIEKVIVEGCCRCCRNCGGTEENIGDLKVMFLLDATHDPVNFAVSLADITDKEGNHVPRSEVKVNTRVTDPTVLGAEYDEATDTGVLSFGAPGESTFALEAVDKDDPSQILATQVFAFKLVAGDPDRIGSIAVSFEGIEEVPNEEPGEESGAEG